MGTYINLINLKIILIIITIIYNNNSNFKIISILKMYNRKKELVYKFYKVK
jgi:hypothetical protein